MAHKRQQEEDGSHPGVGLGGGAGGGQKRQKVPALGRVIMEVMRRNTLHKLIKAMEPLLRKVVKEEVEQALSRHLPCAKRELAKPMYPPSSRSLQLQFITKLSLPIFTGMKIEGEDASTVNLALVDGITGEVVASGPESSMKVEIVVLEGDFESNNENWTFDEFRNNMVKEREGKQHLLSGDVFVELFEGTGDLNELTFTDNSSWTRSRKFRLGARAEFGHFDGVRVREANTEAFTVKDHRGELYKKHYPPVLTDEVWRLEKVGKDGAFHKRLTRENINTVKDFLTWLFVDPQRLRRILGSGMSAKMWEIIVQHGRTCILNNQMYVYFPASQQKTGVVFNVVGEVMGILSDRLYIPLSGLSESQKADAKKLVKVAYQHLNDVTPCDITSFQHTFSAAHPSGAQPSMGIVYNEFSGSCTTDELGSVHTSVSLPDMTLSPLFMGSTQTLETDIHAIDSMEPRYDSSFLNDDLYRESGSSEIFSSSLICDEEFSSRALLEVEQLRYFDFDMPRLSPNLHIDSPTDLDGAVSGFLASRVKIIKRWGILVSVMKWVSSIKRIVASRRLERDCDGEVAPEEE